jgi:hypothetical protein
MRYYEYIMKFMGADHPFGDLATDIYAEVGNAEDKDEIIDVFESGFSEIYDHLTSVGASTAAVNTFVESWAAYLKHEKEGFKNPVPFVVADQLREMNRNLREIGDELRRHNDFMENVSDSLYTDDGEQVSEVIDRIAALFSDCVEVRKDTRGKEYSLLRVCGTVDTYEQN